MTKDIRQLSMMEVAEQIIEENKEPMAIHQVIQTVAQLKGIEQNDFDRLTQLYIDITTSAKFVFCGEDKWDLKDRNLDFWDKDGSYFNQIDAEIEEDEDDNLTLKDYILEDDEDFIDEDEDEEDDEEEDDEEDLDPIIKLSIIDEEEDDEDFMDEDEYNEIMDDYEDMYDE